MIIEFNKKFKNEIIKLREYDILLKIAKSENFIPIKIWDNVKENVFKIIWRNVENTLIFSDFKFNIKMRLIKLDSIEYANRLK